VLLRAKSEGVHVDTSVRVAGVVLVRLHQVEVGTLALGEAVLAVKLELSGNNRVLTPAVHVKSGLSHNEGTGIRHTRHRASDRIVESTSGTCSTASNAVAVSICTSALTPVVEVSGHISCTSVLEEARGVDVVTSGHANRLRASEGVESVRESIDSIGVVERLSTEGLVKEGASLKRGAVVHVLVRLHNPDKLLHRVVEVELDLVGRGTHRLVTSELKLLNEVLVRVLCHSASLISVKEHVVDVEGSSNKGLVVSGGHLSVTAGRREGVDSPQALVNRANVEVDAHLVVLKSNQRQSKARVAAVPELERHVKGGLRKSIARSAHLAGSGGIARPIDVSEGRIADVGKLGGVTNHLVVSTLLFLGKGKLVPDVHPVTVLAIDALATNLNLNLSDHLLTREIQPPSENAVAVCVATKLLVDFRKSHLQVGAVGKVTVTSKGAGNTATEISLAVESLFNRLHCEVGMATVSHLPESDLRIARKIDILGAVSDKLHKSTSHGYTIAKEKNLANPRRICPNSTL